MNQNKTIRDLFQEFYLEFENRVLEIELYDQFALEFCKRLTLLIRCIPVSKNQDREFIVDFKKRATKLATAINIGKKESDDVKSLSEQQEKFREIIDRFRFLDKEAIRIYDQYKSKIPSGQKSLEKEKRTASATGINGGKNFLEERLDYSYQIDATTVTPRWARPNAEKLMPGRDFTDRGRMPWQEDIVEEARSYYRHLEYLKNNAKKFYIKKKEISSIQTILISIEMNLEVYRKAKLNAGLSGIMQDKEAAFIAKRQLKDSFNVIREFLFPYSEILEGFIGKMASTVMQASALGERENEQRKSSIKRSGRSDSVYPANYQEKGKFFTYNVRGSEPQGARPRI